MKEYAVEVNDVTMRFNLAREKVDSLKEYFVRNIKKNNIRDEFYAVKNATFKIEKGDSFAILGSNGSGKSTLLKMIAGIYKPTSGNIVVRGTIAPMIELGAGFDSDLTAAENVFLNGAVLGYSRTYMQEYFNSIIEFAELWEFVDVPVKNFSSGMKARLGFSIATAVDPDILIVDEILSVGDAKFRKKCEQRMDEMKAKGTTLILVSHSMDQVLQTCNKAMWINKGDMMCIGDVKEVCKQYQSTV
ncbi:MAG: teichoic acid transporter ATP-binding protein [Neobacillus sp.]|jgi:ABC-type polysaccharide/polyol phosphate transport system ATPase subunit|nr:teichoic acid transporter ATP-binding protein [Neobacillus sp.]